MNDPKGNDIVLPQTQLVNCSAMFINLHRLTNLADEHAALKDYERAAETIAAVRLQVAALHEEVLREKDQNDLRNIRIPKMETHDGTGG